MEKVEPAMKLSGRKRLGRAHRRLTGAICAVLLALALVAALAPFTLAVAPSFPDVPDTHPHHDAISYLALHQIVDGYVTGEFGPDGEVTRQQFAKMIVLAGGYQGSEADECPFADVLKGGPETLYPDNYVAVCAAKGITTGKTQTTFDPYGNITRHQVISMVVRAADDLQPGLLATPPDDWRATGIWGNDVTHGANAARAEYNSLLQELDLDTLDPTMSMTRGEVARVLYNLMVLLWPETTTTQPAATTVTDPPPPTESTTTTAGCGG